jgi:hypothetical protein
LDVSGGASIVAEWLKPTTVTWVQLEWRKKRPACTLICHHFLFT